MNSIESVRYTRSLLLALSLARFFQTNLDEMVTRDVPGMEVARDEDARLGPT
ncbi:hypothetical protein ABZX95_41260 [Streptomyces sp. NPDC004232]|uniref:hypothetical protein n=1 Tax=Streptomyces sp. NPDC004232 TaxID=3154454 RepID=UPI0033B81D74